MKLYIVEHLQSYSFQLKVVRLNGWSSYSSAKFSPLNCLNVLISCTSRAIFAGRKILVINFCTKSFHEVMESGSWLVGR